MSNTSVDRRHEIIGTLSSLWAQHPEMRFCQLIQYIVGDGDPFYTEDKDFAQKLRDRYNKDMFRMTDPEAVVQSLADQFSELANMEVPRQQMFLHPGMTRGDDIG